MDSLPASPSQQDTGTVAQTTVPPAPPPAATSKSRRKLVPVILVTLLLGLLVLGGGYWWTVGRFVESTDDAYIKSDIVFMAPQVAGAVTGIPVRDNQHVVAGDVLFTIDPADYRIAVAHAEAAIATAEAAITQNQSRIELQQSTLDVDRADVAASQADLTFANEDFDRIAALRKTNTSSERSYQSARASLSNAEASLRKSQAALARDQQQLKVLAAEQHSLEAQLAQANTNLKARHLDLSRTVIRAPVAGRVGNRQIEIGAYVEPGTTALSLVPDGLYVEANFKETQIQHFKPGMPVTITADMLGGATLSGHIDSLSPATGAEFAVLPPQNATGNFTKIVQRVPVRIDFDPGQPSVARLRAGTSVTARIDIRDAGSASTDP